MEKEDKIGFRPLKNISAGDLEDAIAEAISKITGKQYEGNILRFDFNPESELNAWMSDAVEVRIIIKKKQDLSLPRKQE